MKRVGILTSGGDCPGLNATIRGVAKALYQRMGDDVEIIGIMNGYDGLINGNYRVMDPSEFSGILTVGGTILGTKRTPFKMMRVVGDDNVDKVAAIFLGKITRGSVCIVTISFSSSRTVPPSHLSLCPPVRIAGTAL